MAARTSPTFRRRQLARRIHQLRQEAGLTLHYAADGLDMSKSALSRKENGEVATSVHELRSMMDLYDHYDPELLGLARAGRQKGWWRDYGLDDRGFPDLETEAVSVREAQIALVPGLLQTEEYMRQLFEEGNPTATRQTIDGAIGARLERQKRLTSSEMPLQTHVLLDEGVLRRPIIDFDGLIRQLHHVREIGRLANVTVQVLPYDAAMCTAVQCSFCLLSYDDPEQEDVFWVEHVLDTLYSEQESDIRKATELFDRACARALGHDESLCFIERVAAELGESRSVNGTPCSVAVARE